ncbi:uncharacterized protein si:ch211-165g14.1 isoform X1 [Electrophorus electricus]|nr:uncharacterized protein si:ch211-165g14.1 isoform X1 [Electrophorus electricus]
MRANKLRDSPVMDPLNHAKHLQEPLPTALDLSMGCKRIPAKMSSLKALDLVKKTSWSDCNSGTNDVGASGTRFESHVSKPFKQVQSDVPQLAATSEFSFESRCSAERLHGPGPVHLVNGQPAVAETLSQCPTSNPLFTEHGSAGATADESFTHLTECPRKARIAASENTKMDTDTPLRAKDSAEGVKNLRNGLHSQLPCAKTTWHGKCTTDTVSAGTRTRGPGVLHDGTSFIPVSHSTCSVSFESEALTVAERRPMDHKHNAVETLSSECTGSGENSPCTVECISSDDSDVIEVPVRNRRSSNGLLLTESVAVRKVSQNREALFSPRQGTDHAGRAACSTPERVVRNGYHASEHVFCNPAETVEPGELLPPAVLLDSDPETDVVSKNVPSTSDMKNTERNLGPLRDEGSSVSLSRQEGAPASKKKNQTRAGPKRARPGKMTGLCPGGLAAASAAKRRRRKSRQSGSSSMFAPREPEIKLKYATYKEEKREGRGHGFAPYVRVELSACTIVNFREEDDDAQVRKGRQATVSCVSSGVIPSTSHLALGRPSVGSGTRADQACCLCGRTSNTSGLGDLHGPYYPCGPQPNSKTHLAEGGADDRPQTQSPLSVGGVLDGKEMSPTKRLRKRCTTEAWPGAPEGGERWVHEDCSVWSAGVFLVKGKLYGLEEALRLTQDIVCSCCRMGGATLGCFFRGCQNKYHFPCAVQADCMLSEENFTARCPKHKDKSPRTSTSRLQNR